MAKIPDFLLRSLYVKGSLSNHEDGFEFEVKNELGPVRIVGVQPLKVDRKPVSLDQCHFVHDGKKASFKDVSTENSLLLRKGDALLVQVDGSNLNRSRHTLGIGLIIKDIGSINFSISDRVK